MTVSSGVLGGTVGIGGSAAGGSSDSVRAAAVQLAYTGAGHLTETIALGAVLIIGGVATLGLARRHRLAAAAPAEEHAPPLDEF